MENKIVIANMKMYMNIDEIRDYLTKVENKITDNVILCPSNIYIPYFLEKNYKVGIQNVYFDVGQNWMWTTIIDTTVGGQVLCPRDWVEILNEKRPLEDIEKDFFEDKHCLDKPKKN